MKNKIKDVELFRAELEELGNDMKAAVKEMSIDDVREGGRPGVYAYITAANIVLGIEDYFKSPGLNLEDLILGCVIDVAQQFNDNEKTMH